jgi:hypothetical protein
MGTEGKKGGKATTAAGLKNEGLAENRRLGGVFCGGCGTGYELSGCRGGSEPRKKRNQQRGPLFRFGGFPSWLTLRSVTPLFSDSGN